MSATSFEGTPASFGSSGYSSSTATKIEEIVDLRKGRSAAAAIGYGRLGPAYGATDIKWGSLETAGKIAMGCKNGSVAIWDVASQSLGELLSLSDVGLPVSLSWLTGHNLFGIFYRPGQDRT